MNNFRDIGSLVICHNQNLLRIVDVNNGLLRILKLREKKFVLDRDFRDICNDNSVLTIDNHLIYCHEIHFMDRLFNQIGLIYLKDSLHNSVPVSIRAHRSVSNESNINVQLMIKVLSFRQKFDIFRCFAGNELIFDDNLQIANAVSTEKELLSIKEFHSIHNMDAHVVNIIIAASNNLFSSAVTDICSLIKLLLIRTDCFIGMSSDIAEFEQNSHYIHTTHRRLSLAIAFFSIDKNSLTNIFRSIDGGVQQYIANNDLKDGVSFSIYVGTLSSMSS